jgi:tetratricopeptide (TPR) repeat protein
MRPLGTITMYYQFIDEETISVIDDIMEHAENYYDFVIRLGKRACLEVNPSTLAHIAAVHAWRLSANDTKRELFQRFGEKDPIIKSWSAAQHELGIDELFGSISKAIETAMEDWLRIELFCLKTWYARYHIKSDELWYLPLERAEAILQEQSEMECFAALVHTVRSEVSFMDQFLDRAYDTYTKGMEMAKKYDDQFQIYQLLWTCSSWIKTYDARRALNLQEEAYELAKSFGASQKIAEAMADMGRISECLGEYDLAIQCYQNSLNTYGSPEMELYREVMDSPTFGLSRIYCELGNGTSGLEWIDLAFDIVGDFASEIPYLFAQRAEALLLLKRNQEAAHHLETCHRVSLISGGEGYLALCELATGYLEIAQGDPFTAIQTLIPGFEYLSQGPAAIYINRFLIALTRAEIAANLDGTSAEASERWMFELEKHAREKGLPGILMMHALLKTEYLLSRGQTEYAIEILSNSLNKEYSDTAKTLYDRVEAKLRDLQNL